MVFKCYLCETENIFLTYYCVNCRRIKHLINLYGSRVYDVLEKVLVISEPEENDVIEDVINNDIKNKRDYINKSIKEHINKKK